MFNATIYENSGPNGIGVLEIVSDSPETGAQPPRFVPLKRTELTGEVAGPFAALNLTQTYGFSQAQFDKTIEAIYRFPLPGDAAVTGVRARFGEVEIQAELKERQEAEADYAQAVRQGRQAALAARESPDVFTLRVAGVQPDQDVIIETDYVQLARPEGPDWTLRLPLTTAPRFVRSDEADSPYAAGQPLFLLRDPGHRFALDLAFRQAGAVTSPTHKLAVTEAGSGSLRVRLQEGETVPDRDCVLAWRPVQDAAHPGLSVLLHDDKQSGWIYFLALVAPPAAAPPAGVPREVVLLVDHSGSMEGAKWQAADWAVNRFLRDLGEQDIFALGLFHNTALWFQEKGLSQATADNVEKAIVFLEQHKDSGGTELGVALEQALRYKPMPGERSRHALIVTDAQVSDAGRILQLADSEAGRKDRRRISVLCIDAAPNAFLATELAERGGGVAKFLTSDPAEEDITTALDNVLESFRQPMLADLHLEVDRPGVQTAGRALLRGRSDGTSAIDMGDLPRGRAVWVTGRVQRGDRSTFTFAVTVGGREVVNYHADLAQQPQQRPALKALFGARRVLALEYLLTSRQSMDAVKDQLRRLGYDADAALRADTDGRPTVYQENAQAAPHETLRALLVREALDYGLASAATAFVAQRKEAGKPVEETVVVPNALPQGWSEVFYGASARSAAAGGASVMRAMSAAMPVSYDVASMAAPPPSSLPAGGFVAERRLAEPDRGTRPSPTTAPKARNVLASGVAGLFKQEREVYSREKQVMTPQYSGVPVFVGGEAVLFDTARTEDAAKLPEEIILSRLQIRLSGSAPDANAIGPDVMILLFVDDMTTPRAKVRLADLLRQGGVRPLNIRRSGGSPVRIVLVDPFGALAHNPPNMEVALG